jgi:hypothetical protein
MKGDVKRNVFPDGLTPGHGIVVEAASPIYRYARTLRRF